MQNYKTMAHVDFTGSRQHSVQYFNCNFEDAILSEQMAKDLQAQKKAQQASEQQDAPTAQQRQAEGHSQRDTTTFDRRWRQRNLQPVWS